MLLFNKIHVNTIIIKKETEESNIIKPRIRKYVNITIGIKGSTFFFRSK